MRFGRRPALGLSNILPRPTLQNPCPELAKLCPFYGAAWLYYERDHSAFPVKYSWGVYGEWLRGRTCNQYWTWLSAIKCHQTAIKNLPWICRISAFMCNLARWCAANISGWCQSTEHVKSYRTQETKDVNISNAKLRPGHNGQVCAMLPIIYGPIGTHKIQGAAIHLGPGAWEIPLSPLTLVIYEWVGGCTLYWTPGM